MNLVGARSTLLDESNAVQGGDDLGSLIPHLRDVLFRTRGRARWTYLSPAWATMTGYSVEESLGRHILELVHPEDREQNNQVKEQLEAGRTSASRHIKRMIRKDGGVVWVEVDVRTLHDHDGNFLGSVGTLRDVSERIQLQTALNQERRLARITLAALSDGVITVDAGLCIEFMNAAAMELTQSMETNNLGVPIIQLLRLENADLDETIRHSMARQEVRFLGGRTRLIRNDGTSMEVDLTISPLAGAGEDGGGCVIVLRDVHEQRALQASLTYQANHDPLTQLSNRTSMQEALARTHSRCVRNDTTYTLLLADLDHFKVINDHYGHVFGDEALKLVARVIRGGLREGDWLARWGGEEFLYLLPDTGAQEGAIIAERIRTRVEELDIWNQGLKVPVTVSIGVSSNLTAEDSSEAVLLRADAALYEAKQAGRNQVWNDGQGGLDSIGMAVRVQEALQLGWLRLAFQPIFDLSSGKQVGKEALARLWGGNGRFYEAEAFIHAAQRLHLLHRVDAALIPQAMGHCTAGVLTGAPQLHFVNVSADMLRRPEQVENMLIQAQQNCASCGDLLGKTKPLVLELSEREFMADVCKVREALAPLLDFGMQLAIDHFGSGYASLRYLGDLPVNFVKIERELLCQANQNSGMRAVIRGVRQMAEDLGALTIADHVEDAATDELIREMGINWAQGPYYAMAEEPPAIM